MTQWPMFNLTSPTYSIADTVATLLHGLFKSEFNLTLLLL